MSTSLFPRSITRFSLGLALIIATMLAPKISLAETWTSLRGTFSVEAKMLGLWNDSVILQMDDGRRVSVNLLDLRSESRIQAKEIARRLETERQNRIGELKTQADASSAPAPDPLPQPDPAQPYVAPQANATPSDFLDQVDSALMAGHLIVLYDALPPSYRQNVDEIVQLSASTLDATTWNSFTNTIHQVGDLIVTRQRWFLSSPRIASLGEAEQEFFSGPVLSFAGLLQKAFEPSAMQLDTLQSGDFRQWLEGRDAAMAPYLAELIDLLGLQSLQQFTVESEENGVAMVNVSSAGISMSSAYVQVEGYWIPQSLAETWQEDVEEMKQAATSVETTGLASASLFLQPAQLVLGQLANAADAGSFHAQLELVLAPAETMLSSFASSLGPTFAGNQTGRGNTQGGYSDYEMGMEGDMEMEMEMEMDMDMDMEMEMEMEMEEEMGGEGELEMRGVGFGGPNGS